MPPATAIPPIFGVGSIITIDKELDDLAAVIAAAKPPGVAPYMATSYADTFETKEINTTRKVTAIVGGMFATQVYD